MPAVSGSGVTLLRSGPPVVEYYLAIMPRAVVFACSLNNASADWGDTALPYDGVTEGNWWDVVVGQTLLVYSSSGVYKGKVRLRSITAATITVSATFDVEWANNDLLRVVNVFEPWDRPTNMIETGDGITYYKDTDVAWSSNNAAFPPKANAGVGFAGFLGSGGTVDVQFDGADSFANAPGASIASYSWDIGDGAFVVGDAASAAITARFSSAGFRWVILTVTDSNGQTGRHILPVWTFGGSYQPLTSTEAGAGFSIKRRTLDRRDCEVQIEAFGGVLTPDDVAEGTGLALFTRTTINGSQVTDDLGCPFPGRRQVPFVGWILKDSVRWDPETGTVTFSAGTIGKVADDLPGYATFIQDVDDGDEDSWHTGVALTVRSTIFFLWHWHSNLDELAYMEIAPTEQIAGRNFPEAPPFKQAESALLYERGVFAHLGVTRWGSVHVRYDPQILDDADRNGRATVMGLSSQDWTTELVIEKAHRPQLSSILGGGIAYDGSDGVPYRGRAPGRVGRQSGRKRRINNLILADQDDLNDKLGRLLATESSPWRDVTIENYYDIWEPALQEYLTLTVSASENPRGHEFDTSTRWVVRRVEVEDVAQGAPTIRTVVEVLTVGFAGVTVAIPNPPLYPVPDPPPELPPITPEELGGTGEVVIVGTVAGGVCFTLNAVSGSPPTWYQRNAGLVDSSFIADLVLDPNAPSNRAACLDASGDLYTVQNWRLGDGVGDDWALTLTEAQALTLIGAGSGELLHLAAANVGGTSWLFCVVLGGAHGTGSTRILYSTDWGATWGVYPALSLPYWSYFNCVSCTPTGSRFTGYARIGRKDDGGFTSDVNGTVFIDPENERLIVAASSYDGALSRSCVVSRSIVDTFSDWAECCRVPEQCLSFPYSCSSGDCGAAGADVGGNDAATASYTGPGGACVGDNGLIYLGCWRVHEDDDADEPFLVGEWDRETHVDVQADVGDAVAWKRGMMAAPPAGSGYKYVALDNGLGTPQTTTDVWVDGDLIEELDVPFRDVYCFPELIDGNAIVYLGRSYLAGERASLGDEVLFYVSEKPYPSMATYFADKTGNLYDLGATGVTVIRADTAAD